MLNEGDRGEFVAIPRFISMANPTETILGQITDQVLQQFGGAAGIGDTIAREVRTTFEGYTPTEEDEKLGIKPIPRASPATCQQATKLLVDLAKLRDSQTLGIASGMSLEDQRALLLHEAIQKIAHDPETRRKFAAGLHSMNPEALTDMVTHVHKGITDQSDGIEQPES